MQDPLLGAAADLAAWGVVRDASAELAEARARCSSLPASGRWLARGFSLDALVAAAAEIEVVSVDPSRFLERLGDALGLPLVDVEADEVDRLGPFDRVIHAATVIGPPWRADPAEWPELRGEPWVSLGVGGDAGAWRAGDRVARVARHPALTAGLRREHVLLRWLQARLGTGVPTSERVLASPAGAVSIQRFCPGRPATRADAGTLGPSLGRWLGELHGEGADAPADAAVGRRFDTTPARILRRLRLQVAARCAGVGLSTVSVRPFGLPDALAARIDAFLAAPPPPPGRTAFIHGDLTPEHLLLDPAGHLATVVDWADAAEGDPMRDLGYLAMWGGDHLLEATLVHYPRALSAEDIARVRFHRRRSAIPFLAEGAPEHDPVACATEAFAND